MAANTLVEKKRDYAFDNIKALLIFLVVFGHLLESIKGCDVINNIYRCIYLFHMPLFVIISGYFSKKAAKSVLFSVRTALIPALLFIIIYKVVECLVNGSIPTNFGFYLIEVPFSHWYLLSLAYWRLLTPVLAWLSKKKVPVLPLLFILGLLSGIIFNLNPLSVIRGFSFFPYYWIGYLLEPETVTKLRSGKKILPAAAMVLVLASALLIFSNVRLYYAAMLQMRQPYSAMRLTNWMGVWTRALIYLGATALSFAIISLMPNKKIPILSYTGTNTLPVYILQSYLVMMVIRRFGLLNGMLEKFGVFGTVLLLLALAAAITLILQLPPFSTVVNSINKLSNAICTPRKKAESK